MYTKDRADVSYEGVLSQSVGRGDILIQRGFKNSFCARWQEYIDGVLMPHDLRGKTAYFELKSREGNLLFRQQCITDSAGYAMVKLNASAFQDWQKDTAGKWDIYVLIDNDSILLSYGNYLME